MNETALALGLLAGAIAGAVHAGEGPVPVGVPHWITYS